MPFTFNLRNYAPTELLALTPHGVELLVRLLEQYEAEPGENDLRSLLLLQLHNLNSAK